jgi:2-amino-4-hydroxy-6-hydroxymethyldihydropteridine diphosphokinase
VYLGLGANLGDRLVALRDGLAHLGPFAEVERVSSLYETEPVGGPPQPPYYNAVCRVRTALTLERLLRELKQLEQLAGRRPGVRWGPRPLDLDILLAGDTLLQSPDLQVPHPRLAERAFVLIPLAELAPALWIPSAGATAADMRDRVDCSGVRLVAGPDWWRDA